MRFVPLVTFIFIGLVVPSSIYAQENINSINLERNDAYFLNISDSDQSNLDLEGDNTLEVWVKIESLGEGDLFIINKADPYNSDSAYYLFINGQGKIEGRYSSDGSLGHGFNIRYVSESLFPVNEWVHVSVTFDISEQEVKLYLNGEDVLINVFGSIGPIIYDSNQDFMIGARLLNSTMSHFDGKIDEVRVWDRLRTQTEIQENMSNELFGNESGLVGYWQFDGNYRDSSLSGNDLLTQGAVEYDEDVPFAGVVVEDSPYPLYTQIESPYPSVEETGEWADDIYANGAESWCGNTIAGCGCVISSLVMAGRNASIETDILGGDVNPGNINSYLQSVNGYTSNGAVRWLAASAYLGELTSEGKIATRFSGEPKRPGVGEDVMDFIDDSLVETGENAVLGYKDGHFVWLPEKTTDGYVVRDPWWYETQTGDDIDPAGEDGEYIRDYDNLFTDARVIEISDDLIEFSGTGIEAHLTTETAEMLFKNAVGDKVGYEEGSVLIDLDRATYGNTEVIALDGVTTGAPGGKHLLVHEAGEEFTIDVIGTGVGEFELEFFTMDEFGDVQTFNLSGLTFPGVVTTFTFNLETGEVEELPISYEQFLLIMDSLLDGLSPQQKAFFERWAKKIFDNMEEKTISQTIQSIEVFGKLLVAKKVDNPIMGSVLDKLKSQIQN
tara:strand:- start:8172 stop:10175 length:2004 start_codon:yes stop_codon:yes gene_type:complete